MLLHLPTYQAVFSLSLTPCGIYNPKYWNFLEHRQDDITLMPDII